MDLEQRVDREIPELLAQRLRTAGAGPDASHLVFAALVGVLFWRDLSHSALLAWTGAVVAATAASVWVRRHVRVSQTSPERTLTLTRAAAVALGLAWGFGAARAASLFSDAHLALVVAVFAVLLAVATVTLVADLPAFAAFGATLLLPLWLAIAGAGATRVQTVALVLIPLLGGTLGLVYLRSHGALRDYLRTLKRLELSESETRRERSFLDALLGSAPIAIAALDREGRVLGVNGAFEQLFGYTAADITGMSLDSVVVPDRGRAEARELLEQVRLSGRATAEVERLTRGGRLIPVRFSAAMVSDVAEQTFFVLYDDLSAIEDAHRAVRAAQEQYRELVESASDLVWQVDREGRWTFLNAACLGLYGAEPRDLLGHPLEQRVDPAHLEQDRAAFRSVLEGKELTDYETVHRDLRGQPKHLSFAARPVRDAKGAVVGARGTTRDVTERAAAREALEHARELAERAAQTKSAFLANVSHEIRTPLNGVLGMVELLLETELSPEQRRTAELTRTSAEALLELINDILDFSKIEAARIELEDIAFDLPALVDSTVRVLAVRASVRRLELISDVRADVPRRVRGDPSRLRQVLTNLIGNAVKFTEQGEVVVSVSTRERRDGMAMIQFSVRDTGIGIAPEHLGAIFQEFTQADASHTRKYGGTGLGLAISRRLVELMGGDIRVTSEVGRGSEFTFCVPLSVEAAVEPAAPGRAGLQGARVLVVDDHATSRRVVRETLGEVGCVVEEAEHAMRALEVMHRAYRARAAYDLVVIDAYMPDTDGFQLAQAIRDQPALAATRLMMLTSAGHRGDARRCKELGITGYLVKPVAGAELVEAAAAVVSGAAAEGGLVTRHTIQEHRRQLRILLAEDNKVNQEVAVAMLRKRGHDVDIAETGRQAVDAVARGRYDVVLMDIQMPEMDGVEATRAIRGLPQGRDLPIVACTAHALAGERERYLAAGMTGYLTKPFKPVDLFAAVEGWGGGGVGIEGIEGMEGVEGIEGMEGTGKTTAARRAPPAPSVPSMPSTPSIPSTPPAEPPLDIAEFRRTMRDAGVEEAADSMLQVFAADAPKRLEALAQAIQAGEAKPIERAAHAFKSAAGTVTARQLADALKAVELAAKGGDVGRARALFPEAQRAALAVLAHLRQQPGPGVPG